MIKIQLVDDEPNILSALKRLLKPQGWQINAFSDVEAALADLLVNDYAVIVSDYRMPTADGVTYLQFVKQRQPDAVRLVLSAYGDRQSMMKAINQAEVYRYLSKPWHDAEVETAIQAAVDIHQLRVENRRLVQQVHAREAELRAREQELLRLERENPGITRVRRDGDGSIVIDDH